VLQVQIDGIDQRVFAGEVIEERPRSTDINATCRGWRRKRCRQRSNGEENHQQRLTPK
jgi:hypothetical protein